MRTFGVIGLVLLVSGLWAGAGRATETCGLPDAAAVSALAGDLAGDWSGEVVSAFAVIGGKPRLMPSGGKAQPAHFAALGGQLLFSDATTQAPIALAPYLGSRADFALPGEAPLGAAELMAGPGIGGTGACPAPRLAQFEGEGTLPSGPRVTIHAFVLGPDRIVTVLMLRAADGKGGFDEVRGVSLFTR